jgi:hypothetical protein
VDVKAGRAWGVVGLLAAALAACGDDGQSPVDPAGGTGGTGGADAGTDSPAGDATDTGPDVAPTPCDFQAQDCEDPDAKCSVVQQGGYASVCVPRQGDGMPGESCERTALGHDDCGAGSVCSPAAQTAGNPMACRTLCNANGLCTAPERCYRFSPAPLFGMCVPECVFFETDCGMGRHCLLVADAGGSPFPICDDYGDVGEEEPCASAADCGEGMACATFEEVRACRSYCDAANPCQTAGRTCAPLGIPELSGLGVCVPS